MRLKIYDIEMECYCILISEKKNGINSIDFTSFVNQSIDWGEDHLSNFLSATAVLSLLNCIISIAFRFPSKANPLHERFGAQTTNKTIKSPFAWIKCVATLVQTLAHISCTCVTIFINEMPIMRPHTIIYIHTRFSRSFSGTIPGLKKIR